MPRNVHVPAHRFAGWLERFEANNPDGPQRILSVEEPLPVPLVVLLIRRGGYAVAVSDGLGPTSPRLVAHKVGTRHVQSRTAAGGWSQQRFARRRGNQADELVRAVRDHAVRLLVPAPVGESGLSAFALVVGGDRTLVAEVLDDPRLAGLAGLPRRELYDVPDPTRAVLDAAKAARQAAPRRPGRPRGAGEERRLRGYSGPGPDPRDPATFGAVLDRLMRARGWQRPTAEASLFGRWDKVVGSDIAAHSRPVKLDGGVLTVEEALRQVAHNIHFIVHVILQDDAWRGGVRRRLVSEVRQLTGAVENGRPSTHLVYRAATHTAPGPCSASIAASLRAAPTSTSTHSTESTSATETTISGARRATGRRTPAVTTSARRARRAWSPSGSTPASSPTRSPGCATASSS